MLTMIWAAKVELRGDSQNRSRWNRSMSVMWRAYLNMGLDLNPELLEVLDDRAVNRTAEVGVLVSDNTSLVANGVVYVL